VTKTARRAENAVDIEPDIHDEAWRTAWETISDTINGTQSNAFTLLLRMTGQR
jgi:hypothetical protein